MINVKLKKNKSKEYDFIEISGHAMSADYGQDIVCAGVSSVSIGVLNSLENEIKSNNVTYEIKDGYISIKVVNSNIEIQHKLEVLDISLKGIYLEHENFINYNVEII